MYCEFQETGEIFKNKKIYKCNNCGLILSLENPEAKILCFPYATSLFTQEVSNGKPEVLKNAQIVNNNNDITKIMSNVIDESHKPKADDHLDGLCSQQDIEKRLSICKQCNYYKDDACMLCGCHIVREKNYKNKLANKHANCPDGRWGPIN
jgi:hypothetical protein